MFSNHISQMQSIWNPTRSIDDNLKMYSIQNDTHSAIFVVIEVGNSMRMISVYGNFDHAKLGGSMNLPPELSDTPSSFNLSLQQMIAYKNDAPGAAFFSKPGSPPACNEFNYCLMVMTSTDDVFGIKSSSYKTGDADVYKFKISELSPMTLQSIQSPNEWCKPKTTVVKALNTQDSKFAIGFSIAIVLIVAGYLFYLYRMRNRI